MFRFIGGIVLSCGHEWYVFEDGLHCKWCGASRTKRELEPGLVGGVSFG